MSNAASNDIKTTTARIDQKRPAQIRANCFAWTAPSHVQQANVSGTLQCVSTKMYATMQNAGNEWPPQGQIQSTCVPSDQSLSIGASKPQEQVYFCWQHGCQGRPFTNLSNYKRHCREQDQAYAKPACPRCGKSFLREKVRDDHYLQRRCRVVSIDANGVPLLIPLDQSSVGAR
ncbi:unnamed protein product [Cercospora beticola]|nr:unnamed protein product [Cercospora beticola]